MEKFYKALNKVQIKNKKQKFKTNIKNEKTLENIIKDVNLKYDKKITKTKVEFIIYPNDEEKEKDYFTNLLDDDMQSYNDEIPEDGQIF